MDDLMVRMAEALRAWRNGNGSMVKVGFDRRQILFNETGRLLAEYDALKALVKSGEESGQKACASVVAWWNGITYEMAATDQDCEWSIWHEETDNHDIPLIAISNPCNAAASPPQTTGVGVTLPASSKSPSTASVAGWMDGKPTEPGYYWYGDDVVHVFVRPGHSYLCIAGEPTGMGKRDFVPVAQMGNRWSTRIAAPDPVSHTTGQEKGNG